MAHSTRAVRDGSYWHTVANARLGRRRALIAAGAASGAAALLAACGGGSNSDGTTSSDAGSVLYKPSDTISKAVAGGVLKHYSTADITHFDALAANTASTVNGCSVFAYNRLLKFKSGIYPKVADGSVEGEMAQSYEISPDKLTLTMKLRPNQKWDPRAPTNGRVMDIQDVLFSYRKFARVNPSGANVDANRNPSAPVESVTAPDGQTIVVKLKKPDATVIGLFAATDHLYIMPRESDGGFDPATTVRGNGPWMLEEYTPSVRFVWKRNPSYHISKRPFPETMERPIVTESAQRLAQFRAGNIYTDVVAASQETVIQLRNDVPRSVLYLPNTYPNSLSPSMWFGYEGNSPFKDVRVRQAFSMLVDREAYDIAINNADTFEKEGLGQEVQANTCVTAGWGPYWLDPNDKSFGENAKYLKYDPTEAKRLLAAAGAANPTIDMFFNSEQTYGIAYNRAVEVFAGFFREAGVKVNQNPFVYAEFLNNYYFGYRSGASTQGGASAKKGYNGISVQAERPYASAVNLMLGSWHSTGGSFHGLTPTGNDAFAGDPKLDAMIEEIQSEFDNKKQISLSHDLIRYMTGQTYMIPRPVANRAYEVWWPVIGNIGIKERWPNNAIWTESAIDWWIDTSKPPLA
jgi:peptide/nickel transport system substrate-binding protein